MIKKLLISLITFVTLAGISAKAQVLFAEDIKKEVSHQVEVSYAKYTDARLEAKVISLPFNNLSVPDGQVKYVVSSNQDKFLIRDLKKVDVYVKGKLVRTFNAPVDVKAYKQVLVASQIIERDKPLTKMNTKLQEHEISQLLGNLVTEEMLKKDIFTRKYFKENEIIDKRFVKFQPDVARYSYVTAVFDKNGIQVAIKGLALNDAMVGEYVNIKNEEYNRIYTGKVTAENTVLIR
jgi:flagella basal body P-ring formation protein FlgA